MKYTQEVLREWINDIPAKIKFVTEVFAKEQKLNLDFSMASLDNLEKWILKHYDVAADLRDEEDLLDLLALYVGETFMKYTGGEWFVELENKKNIYYGHLVVKTVDEEGDTSYRSMHALCTSCISRNKGNLISATLKKNLQKN